MCGQGCLWRGRLWGDTGGTSGPPRPVGGARRAVDVSVGDRLWTLVDGRAEQTEVTRISSHRVPSLTCTPNRSRRTSHARAKGNTCWVRYTTVTAKVGPYWMGAAVS